jgi:hypothetical protein
MLIVILFECGRDRELGKFKDNKRRSKSFLCPEKEEAM